MSRGQGVPGLLMAVLSLVAVLSACVSANKANDMESSGFSAVVLDDTYTAEDLDDSWGEETAIATGNEGIEGLAVASPSQEVPLSSMDPSMGRTAPWKNPRLVTEEADLIGLAI